MHRTYVWDPVVRLFHWSLAAGFAANALVTDPEGNLHEYIGYAVAALIGIRVIWGLIGSRHARFSSFPPDAGAAAGQLSDIATGRIRRHPGHSPLGALMIYNLLLTITGIALTGYLMTTNMFWGIEWPEALHEALVSWAEISIVLHVAAVLFESRRTKVNLARAMVTGYKEGTETSRESP
ncbi:MULTISPECIES: cytochrome b/b6 domain-containing protein [Leisingera]|jgi:cytochrome b|uniref:cytochrome b/b6 domain-containing protein n=1 Tax=Leisingera TaxID=191028 RepID=UPI0011509F88|nr:MULTISPECIES: cytochrome b/b6 domain-containing protein [Leisingera]QDI76106.1 cytochrome B [Leisingera aquaemixtae]